VIALVFMALMEERPLKSGAQASVAAEA